MSANVSLFIYVVVSPTSIGFTDGSVDSESCEEESQDVSDEFIDVDAELQCTEDEKDDDTSAVEAVMSKRPRVDTPDELKDSDDEEAPLPKPNALLKSLYEAERLLLRHGRFDACGNLHKVISSVKEVRDLSLVQTDIRSFIHQ